MHMRNDLAAKQCRIKAAFYVFLCVCSVCGDLGI